MIKVQVNRNHIADTITINGHSGYDVEGHDIVCAGVSSIVTTTVNAIVRYDENLIQYESKSGYLKIEVKHNEFVDFPVKKVSQISYLNAFYIGLFQLLSLIPGTSRSGATILGAMLLGCSRTAASEFTFFLGIPVMFGASLLKIIHYGLAFSAVEFFYLFAGMVIAFVVSLYSIRFLLNYVKNHDFRFFGYYRIILGVIVLIYFGLTALLNL